MTDFASMMFGAQAMPGANVLANDIGSPLTATLVAQPAHGTVNLASNGNYNYSQTDLSYTGNDPWTYRASDGTSSDIGTVNVQIAPANTNTNLNASTTMPYQGQSVTFTATVATSAQGVGKPSGSVVFNDNGNALSGAVNLDANGSASFSTSVLALGNHNITAAYAANGIFASSTSNAAPVTVNARPVLDAIPNQSSAEGAVISLQLTASNAGSGGLTYSATNTLPQGLSVNQQTGLISGTIDYAAAETNSGSYTISVTATDSAGASDTKTFTWVVRNTDLAPVLSAIPDQASAEGQLINLPVIATDADGDALHFAASGLPTGLQIDWTNGPFHGTIAAWAANANHGVYQVSVTVFDPSGLTDTKTFIWTVTNPNQVMTTFTVNTTADTPDANVGDGIAADANGKVSLRAAIQEANALDALTLYHGMRQFTIRFDTTAMGGDTIVLLSSLDVYANTRILGTAVSGAPGVWLTSTQAGLNFKQGSVSSVESVGFKNFDDTNALNAFSSIANDGSLYLIQDAFKDNKTTISGGAVFNEGDLVVIYSTFERNQAANSGGAIISNKTLLVQNTLFSLNTAGQNGGALQLGLSSESQIYSSQFVLNKAFVIAEGNVVGQKGGAVSLFAAAKLWAYNTNFDQNFGGQGGAIYNSGGVVIMVGGGFNNNSGFAGGAIHDSTGQLWLLHVNFLNNTAATAGANLGEGGALWLKNTKGTITNSTFAGNSSTNGNNVAYHGILWQDQEPPPPPPGQAPGPNVVFYLTDVIGTSFNDWVKLPDR